MTLLRLNQAERVTMGRRLASARWRTGQTLAQVATQLGVSVNAVKQWERGTVPRDETRAKLATLYGMDETALFAEYAAAVRERLALLERPA